VKNEDEKRRRWEMRKNERTKERKREEKKGKPVT